MVLGWLGWHRGTLLYKCGGLTGEQLAKRAVPPSDLSLLGLIRHSTDVERSWVRRRLDGEKIVSAYWDGTQETSWSEATADSAEADYQALLEEWRVCDETLARHDFEDTFTTSRGEYSCRWMVLHLIDEYARHCGHADLLRERIDGRTGY